MAKKRKKQTKEMHVLHDDCKKCLRQIYEEYPIVKDMKDGCKVHCLQLNGSLQYLKEMTRHVEAFVTGIAKEHGDLKQQKIMSDYFTDISNMISFYMSMKEHIKP